MCRRNDTSTMPSAHGKSRAQYALNSNGDPGNDLYYNSRPESRRHHQTSTVLYLFRTVVSPFYSNEVFKYFVRTIILVTLFYSWIDELVDGLTLHNQKF